MNKTVNINLSGLIFSIEEHAYDTLKQYLEKLKLHLEKVESGDEIYGDIELRIAELFQEKLSDSKQVIDGADVDAVIAQIGLPEEYLDIDENDNSEDAEYVEAEEIPNQEDVKKRFFRDGENSWIGGVCAGIAVYFNIPISLVRVLMVILCANFGVGIIIYFILWFVIPQAETTADYLRMHGKPVNYENIKDKFKNGSKEFKGHAKHHSKEARKNAKKGGEKLKRFIGTFFKIVARVIGVILIIKSIFMISILGFTFYTDISYFDNDLPEAVFSLYELANLVTIDDSHLTWAWASAHMAVFTPLIILLLVGMQLALLKPMKWIKYLYLLLILVFVSGVGISIASASKYLTNISYSGQSEETIDIENADTLYINVLNNKIFPNQMDHHDLDFPNAISITNDSIHVANPEVILYPSLDSNFHIDIIREANGKSNHQAVQFAENINYNYLIDSNVVRLTTSYAFAKTDKIRGQDVKIRIGVPEGKHVQFGDHIDRILNRYKSSYLENNVKTYNNKLIQLKESAFECEKCEIEERKYRRRKIRISTREHNDFLDLDNEEIVELEVE